MDHAVFNFFRSDISDVQDNYFIKMSNRISRNCWNSITVDGSYGLDDCISIVYRVTLKERNRSRVIRDILLIPATCAKTGYGHSHPVVSVHGPNRSVLLSKWFVSIILNKQKSM